MGNLIVQFRNVQDYLLLDYHRSFPTNTRVGYLEDVVAEVHKELSAVLLPIEPVELRAPKDLVPGGIAIDSLGRKWFYMP